MATAKKETVYSWGALNKKAAFKYPLEEFQKGLTTKYTAEKDDIQIETQFEGLVLHSMFEAAVFMAGAAGDQSLSKGLGVMVHTLLAAFPDMPHLAPTAIESYWNPGGRLPTQALGRLASGFPDITIAMAKAIQRTLSATMPFHSLVEIETTKLATVLTNTKYNCKPDAILIEDRKNVNSKKYVVDYKTHWAKNADTKAVGFPEKSAANQARFNADIHKTHAMIIDAWPSGASEANGFVASAIKVRITTYERA